MICPSCDGSGRIVDDVIDGYIEITCECGWCKGTGTLGLWSWFQYYAWNTDGTYLWSKPRKLRWYLWPIRVLNQAQWMYDEWRYNRSHHDVL